MADEQQPPAEERSEQSQPEESGETPKESVTTPEAQTGPQREEALRQEEPAVATPDRFGPAGEPVREVSSRERRKINRRELLKLAPVLALGAFAVWEWQLPLVLNGQRFSDWASGKLFSRHRLEPTYSNSQVAPFDRFPYNYYDVLDPQVDLERWKLTVQGLVKRPGDYTLQQIQAYPKVVQNTRHVCVEGWDVVGNFGGVRTSDFLRAVGADLSARYVEVECADEYYESIDMETMLHPQSLFCYEMYGKPLDRGHGAPLRLQMPTKLGYKQAKYLVTVNVTNVLRGGQRGYWEDQGYSWFAGL